MGANPFTRDEVILALDVLYSAGGKPLTKDSSEIIELCELLGKLPIYPPEMRTMYFRTPSGVCNQLSLVKKGMATGEKDNNVGIEFFVTAFEYEHQRPELKNLADAIRRNVPFFDRSVFSGTSAVPFPEGRLLQGLHYSIEAKAATTIQPADHCEVCQMRPDTHYVHATGLLQLHLLTPLAEMDGDRKYGKKQFITVCPTCHAAIHCYRPWRVKENCGDILR